MNAGELGRLLGKRRALLWIGVGAAVVLGLAILLFATPTVPGRILFARDYVWQTIQRHGVWRVGLDPSFPPFEMLDESGRPVGYDVDLAHRIAELWGVRAEIVALGFDSLPDAVQAGKLDSIVSAWPYDPRATRDFIFSPAYFDAGIRLVVRQGSPIASAEDLAGHRVAVEWGSLGDMIGRRLEREGTALELVPFSTPEEAIAALAEAASVDALLIDNVSLRQAQGNGAQITGLGAPLEGNPYVIASSHSAGELGAADRRSAGDLVSERQPGGTGEQMVRRDGDGIVSFGLCRPGLSNQSGDALMGAELPVTYQTPTTHF
ncbi:MAG: amino acid ABC transporter substrate-binding protein [Caldilineaceae bacterium]|nr:amino acid ABC transporter substrate-binding protein [Caldilineaceae bacterium]